MIKKKKPLCIVCGDKGCEFCPAVGSEKKNA